MLQQRSVNSHRIVSSWFTAPRAVLRGGTCAAADSACVRKRAAQRVQARELAKLKQEEEDIRKAKEQLRVEKEAAVQRALAAAKKEAQERRLAVQEEKKAAVKQTARSAGKTSAVMRSKPVKPTFVGSATKLFKDHSTGISVCVAGAVLAYVAVLYSWTP
jgi:Flp pilus assembly protein TadB